MWISACRAAARVSFAPWLIAKVQRPGVCNAMETLLVDKAVAEAFLPAIGNRLFEKHVEIRGDQTTHDYLQSGISQLKSAKFKPVAEQDYFTEYNDYILNV